MPTDYNYYELLGVAADAPLTRITQAYRDLARRYHPDVCPADRSIKLPDDSVIGAGDAFKLMTMAYDTLSNPSTREQYNGSLGLDIRNLRRKYSEVTTGVFGSLEDTLEQTAEYGAQPGWWRQIKQFFARLLGRPFSQ